MLRLLQGFQTGIDILPFSSSLLVVVSIRLLLLLLWAFYVPVWSDKMPAMLVMC